jgi:hypothetical protein
MLRIKGDTPPVQKSPEVPELPITPEETPDIPSDAPQKRFSVQKLDPAIVVYKTSDMGPFVCSNCQHWEEPNSCGIVQGEIDPEGVCCVYTPPEPEEQGGELGVPEEEAPVAEEPVEGSEEGL